MDECLELHKVWAQADVEYQQKFDALKKFDDEVWKSGQISNPEEMPKEWDRLEEEQRVAYEKREAARKAYKECRQKADQKGLNP